MKLVIGGAFQGQLAFARTLAEEAHIFSDVQEYIKTGLQDGKAREEIEAGLFEKIKADPSLVMTGNEIGYGIVPMDAFEREYREAVGRIMCKIAARAEEVYRVAAGIPMKIK